MKRVRYLTKIENVKRLSKDQRERLQAVTEVFPFRTNSYYTSLINWQNSSDPIKRIVIPSEEELEEWGSVDASKESLYSPLPGLQHKYHSTALFLLTDLCGGYCRFCFRKRLFMKGVSQEVIRDFRPALRYIEEHKEINNVLLTGGDPLVLSTPRLERVISSLFSLDHIRTVRIGSKMLAFNPYRILNDPYLTEMFSKYSTDGKRIYIITHFNHPREMTKTSIQAVEKLQRAGVILANQTPLLRGINDSPEILSSLFNNLTNVGIAPYYVFQCRPTIGNYAFTVPVERSLEIFEEARAKSSGLAKRARLIMSHVTGKIEITGRINGHVLFRYYHVARILPIPEGHLVMCKSNPEAFWFDDYEEARAFFLPAMQAVQVQP